MSKKEYYKQQIIELISLDARIPIVKIAHILNKPQQTVSDYLREIKKEYEIKGKVIPK